MKSMAVIHLAAIGALFAIVIFSGGNATALPHSDSALTVTAPADAAIEFKERMKNALATQPLIVNAIGANDFKLAGQLASDAFGPGLIEKKGKPPLAKYMPQGMKALSKSFKEGVDEFMTLAQKDGVTQQEMFKAYSEDILDRCSACHSVIHLEISTE